MVRQDHEHGKCCPACFLLDDIGNTRKKGRYFPMPSLPHRDLEQLKAELTQHREQLIADEQHLVAVLLRLRQEAESFQEELGHVESRITIIQEDLEAIDALLEKRD